MNTDFETRIATLEAVTSVLQQHVERVDREHASLLEKAVEPLHQLTEDFELTKEHTDARLQEILGANIKLDATDPVFMAVVMRLLEHIDLVHKLLGQRIDAVQDGITKLFGSAVGKVGE